MTAEELYKKLDDLSLNYMLFTDVNDLKGINNKGGFHR